MDRLKELRRNAGLPQQAEPESVEMEEKGGKGDAAGKDKAGKKDKTEKKGVASIPNLFFEKSSRLPVSLCACTSQRLYCVQR